MRRFLILSALLVPICEAQLAVVNAVSAQKPSTTAATASMAMTVGNAVWVVAGFIPGSGAGCGANTISVSDGFNTYTQIGGYQSLPFNCAGQFYAVVATGGTNTISVQSSVGAAKAFSAVQISGVIASPLDSGASTAKQCTTGSSCTSAAFSTSAANELILAGGVTYYASVWTAGAIGGTTATIPAGGSQTNATASGSSVIEYVAVSSLQSSITAALTFTSTAYLNYFTAAFIGTGGGTCTATLALLGAGCS